MPTLDHIADAATIGLKQLLPVQFVSKVRLDLGPLSFKSFEGSLVLHRRTGFRRETPAMIRLRFQSPL